MIFPSLYNAPIVYYALIQAENKSINIEQYDHYTKQTYRNRCRILGGNGRMDMVVPIVKNHGKKTLLKDVKIDYDTPWQAVHWKSINSAYASAPYFEFIQDYIEPVYLRKQNYLIDLNCELLTITSELLNLDINHVRTDRYDPVESASDIREAIHPKRPFKLNSVNYTPLPYHQVFAERYGFVKDLSILDLLFNEGQNAGMILKRSVLHNGA